MAKGTIVVRKAEALRDDGPNVITFIGNGNNQYTKGVHAASTGVGIENAKKLQVEADRRVPVGPNARSDEALARLRYTGKGYEPMNTFARTGKVPPGANKRETKAQVKSMDKAFGKYGVKTQEPITVHRGVSGSHGEQLRALKPGDIITERGFMSTSAIPSDVRNQDAVMQVSVPKGKQVLGGTNYESELIFPRNSQLKYLGVSPSGVLQFEMA